MHDLLKNYAVDGLDYIDKNELVKALKRADNGYYIDDLNYLTMPSVVSCLCGYFPGTIPEGNFCYDRLINRNWQVDPDNVDLLPPNDCIISCRDLDAVERFLDLFYENNMCKKYSLNLPARFEETDQPAEKVLQNLLEKYNGYYRLKSQRFDYRLNNLNDILECDIDSSLEIVSATQDMFDDVPIYNDWYVLKKEGRPVFAYGHYAYHSERIGIKFFSFSDSVHAYGDGPVLEDDVLRMWRFLARKYMREGYIVKGIAVDKEFDNDEMYVRLGMEKYRCFFKLMIDDMKDK